MNNAREATVPPKILNHLLATIALLFSVQAAVAADDAIFIKTTADGSIELSNVPVDAGFEVLVAGSAGSGMAVAAATGAPRPSALDGRGSLLTAHVAQYREMVAEAARRSQVDARLLHAVILVESGYNPQAVSSKGARGLMQLMPDTARRYGIGNALDPLQNILGGASYLHDLLKLFNNDVSLALAAYNAGENVVLRHGSRIPPIRETVAYVPKVLDAYRKLESMLI